MFNRRFYELRSTLPMGPFSRWLVEHTNLKGMVNPSPTAWPFFGSFFSHRSHLEWDEVTTLLRTTCHKVLVSISVPGKCRGGRLQWRLLSCFLSDPPIFTAFQKTSSAGKICHRAYHILPHHASFSRSFGEAGVSFCSRTPAAVRADSESSPIFGMRKNQGSNYST